jgi:hypothetical protein
LHLPDGAKRHNLQNLKKLRDLALDHGTRWYEHARGFFGRDAPDGSLYLVTGCDKSSSWGTVSFSDIAEENGFSLMFTSAGIGEAEATCRSSWVNQSPATVRTGPGDCSDKQNQCVFIRGFKISVRDSPLAAKLLGSVKLTSMPASKSSKNLSIYDSLRRRGSGSSPGNRSSGSSSNSQKSPTESDLDFDSDVSSISDGIFDDEMPLDYETSDDGISTDFFPARSEVSPLHPIRITAAHLTMHPSCSHITL